MTAIWCDSTQKSLILRVVCNLRRHEQLPLLAMQQSWAEMYANEQWWDATVLFQVNYCHAKHFCTCVEYVSDLKDKLDETCENKVGLWFLRIRQGQMTQEKRCIPKDANNCRAWGKHTSSIHRVHELSRPRSLCVLGYYCLISPLEEPLWALQNH